MKKNIFAVLVAIFSFAILACGEGDETSESLYPPTFVQATALSSDSIKVSWGNVSGTFDYFYVSYGTTNDVDSCPYSESAGKNTSIIIENLEPYTKYYFFVRTIGYSNKSSWSEVASTRTKAN